MRFTNFFRQAGKRVAALLKRKPKNGKNGEIKKPPAAEKSILTELSRQSSYIPELTRIYNTQLHKKEFHQGTTTLNITGNPENDRRLGENSIKMGELRRKIILARHMARKSRTHEEMDRLIDNAREMEKEHNDLKEQNLKTLMHSFSIAPVAEKTMSRKFALPAYPEIKINVQKAVGNELRNHENDLPELVPVHNGLGKKVHSDQKTFVITGIYETDSKVQGRAVQMEKLRQKINFLRRTAKKAKAYDEMDFLIHSARMLELAFNNHKTRNLKDLMHNTTRIRDTWKQ